MLPKSPQIKVNLVQISQADFPQIRDAPIIKHSHQLLCQQTVRDRMGQEVMQQPLSYLGLEAGTCLQQGGTAAPQHW